MSEEKAKKAPKAPDETPAPAEAPAAASSSKSHCKVTRMTLPQVEAALENAQKHMGGHYSAYAQSLLAKRTALMRHQAAQPKPAKRKVA